MDLRENIGWEIVWSEMTGTFRDWQAWKMDRKTLLSWDIINNFKVNGRN